MQYRVLGKTGLNVSVLSFGCGAVGGIMVRGAPADQERAVARAIDAGINYFDTAWLYGKGESERNLGRALKQLGNPKVHVATKVMLESARVDIRAAITVSLDASLERLGRDSVDMFFLHNDLTAGATGNTVDPTTVTTQALPVMRELQRQGKARYIGFTALGETAAMHAVLPHFDVAQICFNLLNPTAGIAQPEGYPAQNYELLLSRAHAAGVGTVGIRVLAGGALSADLWRHELGMAKVDPLGSALSYESDVARARRFAPLIEAGHTATPVESALRYAISHADLDTTLIGLSTQEQLETAIRSVESGSLPASAMQLVASIQAQFAGEER
ncbi:MAG: aldo/keto reductase [Betaproteobacteria bacterium]|nr:aldo/keto reductase [Betaproteobacteria bacterium]